MSHSALVLGLAMFSFVMTVIWGMPLLRMLRHFKIGKIIRVEEPDQHRIKMGTPTMGGVLFILPVLLLTGLLNAAALIGLDVNVAATGCASARNFWRRSSLPWARRLC
jgi:phospho-N-acetylmuramoyl-pentapeptide-transferase